MMQPDNHLYVEQANDVAAWAHANSMNCDDIDELLDTKLTTLLEHKVKLGIVSAAAATAGASSGSVVGASGADSDAEGDRSCHTTSMLAALGPRQRPHSSCLLMLT